MQNLKSKLSLKVKIPININEKPQSLSCTAPITDCSHIIDNIYISGYRSSIDYVFLIQNKFTHIINCAGGSQTFSPLYFKEFQYLKIDLRDDGSINILDAVKKLISFLRNIDNENSKILIHCSKGISRAPALVCFYLIWKLNMDFQTAVDFVKEKRKCVDINLGFMFQLEDLSLHKDILRAI
jgi:protein-tyrosine phosphatase